MGTCTDMNRELTWAVQMFTHAGGGSTCTDMKHSFRELTWAVQMLSPPVRVESIGRALPFCFSTWGACLPSGRAREALLTR